MDLWMNILGWVGSICVVAVYGLNSFQVIKTTSPLFYIMNLAGGLLLILFSVYKEAYPNVFINVVWVIIAIPGLIKSFRKV
ncbi:CBU_0592 family membrane protein [Pseudochryseolinea flava]|uniref:CBU-0592-like domain-containing protein n=1 Tax=Pseudochryseolinea flava TaxID=2059302 RepID=A0A364XX61_9BACT|nr:hypothetical protein [Pseudochryseolinea flava]RAV98816.1 hypothetical protein DQQ10_22645 [Pseudochryseolinea flava]